MTAILHDCNLNTDGIAGVCHNCSVVTEKHYCKTHFDFSVSDNDLGSIPKKRAVKFNSSYELNG